jgi:hypothetical protein
MDDNPFVAALLAQAAEHRLRAAALRNCKIDSWIHRYVVWMNDSLEKSAVEQDGLAEVYEGFARRILGEDQFLVWNWVSKDGYLTGPAELLSERPLPKFEWGRETEVSWQLASYFQYWVRQNVPSYAHLVPGCVN